MCGSGAPTERPRAQDNGDTRGARVTQPHRRREDQRQRTERAQVAFKPMRGTADEHCGKQIAQQDSCITRRRKRAKRQIDEGMPGGLGSEDTANVVHEAPAQDELHQPLSFARIAIGVALQAAAAALPTS
eukprot:CAMPEP_0184379700 /NCGR_PEP_ID=MMETSP0007-20130409/4083_1 /TAXON_ID=97485 /ORGANISM="Prymnesium parvum, Strain Texoma1" /LENGTH=129 /DNA_ID=CAMNT_0026724527 /DNA_START=146 /DNA_END=536 /DNA_ORIENTATION=+